jgi:hypothetical protein
MRLHRALTLPLCLALACASSAAPPRAATGRSAAIVYVDAGHSGEVHVDGNHFAWISVLPASVQPGTREAIMVETLNDCSTAELACLGGEHVKLAVPRGKLSVGMKYSVGNTSFEVTRCDGADDCYIADIAVRCEYGRPDDHWCDEAVPRGPGAPSQATYMAFTYNGDQGVTAINLDPSVHGDEFVLEGERGLLRDVARKKRRR